MIWLAGIALPANLCACLVIVNAWTPSATRATIMVGGLLVGNLALLTYLVSSGRTRGSQVGQHPPVAATSQRSGGWFLAKSVTGYASGDALEAMALLLPAASLTILNIVNRIVGSVSTTLVSSILPKLINRSSTSRAGATTFGRWLAGLLSLPFCVVAMISIFVSLPYEQYVLATLAWLLTSGMNVSAQRLAYRFLPPAASVLSIASAVTVTVAVAVIATTSLFTLKVLFVGAIALDALPASFLLWSLSERV